jgi:hypothetical protein
MSSQAATTTERARRPSKFIEGAPATGPELLQQTPTSNELFFHILSEMDEFEKKRKHRGSSSSTDSLLSSNGCPVKDRRPSTAEREGTRSVGLGRRSLDTAREMIGEKKSHKLVGRLRALTGGREKEEKVHPYPGT